MGSSSEMSSTRSLTGQSLSLDEFSFSGVPILAALSSPRHSQQLILSPRNSQHLQHAPTTPSAPSKSPKQADIIIPSAPPPQTQLFTAVTQMLLVSMLSILHGIIVSLNIFAVPIERASPVQHALDGVWEPAISSINVLYAPTAIITSLYLEQSGLKLTATRRLVAISAFGFFAFALSGLGIILSNRFLTSIGVMFLALPFTLIALVKVDLLVGWLSPSLGLAIGLAALTFGVGSVVATSIYASMLQYFSAVHCIAIVAALSGGITLLIAFMLDLPPPSMAPLSDNKYFEIGAEEPEKLTVRKMLHKGDFWFYALVCASFSAGFAVDPYFFKMGSVQGGSGPALMRWYQGGTTLSVFFNLATATVCDVAHTAHGPFSSGARNVAVALLAVQMGTLTMLSFSGANLTLGQWASAVLYLRLCHLAGFNFSALIAADIFGSENASLVFGFGGALSLGLGDGFATASMMLVDRVSGWAGRPQHYVPYYALGAIWSVLGLAAALSLRRLKRNPGQVVPV